MNSRSENAATDTTPRSLARLSATQMLEGYRSGDFAPRDVVDEVIDALKNTDALCKVMTGPATSCWHLWQPFLYCSVISFKMSPLSWASTNSARRPQTNAD